MSCDADSGCGEAAATWSVVALVPVLCRFSLNASVVWALALLLGVMVAKAAPLRWVALGWIGQTLVPAAPLPAVVSSGIATTGWAHAVSAGVAGVLLSQFCPEHYIDVGALLTLSALATAMIVKPQ